jgi:uncharacterized delta-60 repeat protein
MPTALRRLVHALATITAIALAIPAASLGASPGDPYPGFTTFAQHVGPATGHESATDVLVQADGKVVVSLLNDSEVDRRIVRLLPNGQLDPSFATGGVWHMPSDGPSYIRSIALQPDGKIVYAAADSTLPNVVIGRLTPTGEPDITFSSDGVYVIGMPTGSNPLVEDLFVEASGKITFVGILNNGTKLDDLFMGRLSPFGVDDPDFAGEPYFIFGSPYDADADGFGGIAQMPNGNYVVGNPHMGTASMVWRINASGSTRVAANVAFPNSFNDPVDIMATDATHAVVLLEGSGTTGLAYLDVAATPTISQYAGNAGTIQPFPTSFRGHELLRQADGRFFVSGTDSTTSIHRAIMRLNANGTQDTTWGPGGIRHQDGTSTRRFYLDRHSLAFTPDGSLVSAYHAFAGDVRQPRVDMFLARIARVRPEVVTPLEKGTVGTPIDYTVRAVNDGPDASGAGSLTFTVDDGLRVTSWTGSDCTVDARGGTCRYASLAAGASKSVVIKVKAVTAGSHSVGATTDAATYDDDTSNDATSASHPFDPVPPAPAAAPSAVAKPKPAAPVAPKVLRLTLQRITGYDGRVIRTCGTVRAMCIVNRVRRNARLIPAYLRAGTGIQTRRTLLLVMQVKQRGRWVVKYRHRLPIGLSGGLDIKLPTDWRATSSTWRLRTETVGRRGVRPKVSGWVLFQVR